MYKSVCFPDGGGAERLSDKGPLEWLLPLFFPLRFPHATSELSVLRGCRSVYAAAGDESEAVEEVNQNKQRWGDEARLQRDFNRSVTRNEAPSTHWVCSRAPVKSDRRPEYGTIVFTAALTRGQLEE